MVKKHLFKVEIISLIRVANDYHKKHMVEKKHNFFKLWNLIQDSDTLEWSQSVGKKKDQLSTIFKIQVLIICNIHI